MSNSYSSEYAQYEFSIHGEDKLLAHLAGKLDVIFDVGANIGEWTKMSRIIHPNAEIHNFEIIPETYKKMINNIILDNKIIPNSFGLSDNNGILPIKFVQDFDALSSYIFELHNNESDKIINGLVFKGDSYVNSREINYIDYLKLDVEGAEGKVLAGFTETLKSEKIGMIQFEYGYACVYSKWLLMDAYKLLNPLGFNLGKITQHGIEFHDYHHTKEDFQGPDYLAVHNSKMHLFNI